MIIGYARVSTKDQNLDRQIEALNSYGVDKIIEDKASGKDFNRPGYESLKVWLRGGDTLVIKELDRLGRNYEQIKEEFNYWRSHKISIVIIDNPMLSTKDKSDLEQNLISNIVFELLAYMSEKERIKIKTRQREGIAAARAKGKHLGRPKMILPNNFMEVYSTWKKGDITAKAAMETLGLKRSMFYNFVKKYEGE